MTREPEREQQEPHEDLVSRADAARLLHLSPATLATWASRGKAGAPPMRKHGNRVVYSRTDLLRWSQEQTVG